MKQKPSEGAQALVIYFLASCVIASFYTLTHWDELMPWYLKLWQRVSGFLVYGAALLVAVVVVLVIAPSTVPEDEE